VSSHAAALITRRLLALTPVTINLTPTGEARNTRWRSVWKSCALWQCWSTEESAIHGRMLSLRCSEYRNFYRSSGELRRHGAACRSYAVD